MGCPGRGIIPRLVPAAAVVALATAAASGCSRPAPPFSGEHALAHVKMLADRIGSRPAGTRANEDARAYIADRLREYGFQVRVQETDARARTLGLTARVSNIIGVLPGQRTEAIGLLSHYDSVPDGPGAGDDALGVAVSLEAARLAASRQNRTWSLFVLVTDAEELGLVGASALVTDREVTERLHAYLNVEAIGSAGVPVLFETGPGNGWLTAVWARNAPHPRGGSYAIEVYKRLPNDTDFSVMKTRNIPGLNFAAVGDSYAYHTPRDDALRLQPRTIQTMGENAAAMVEALQDVDITQRSASERTFFDVAGRLGVSFGPRASFALSSGALLLGLIAWIRTIRAVIRTSGVVRWLLLAVWTAAAAAAVCAGLIAGAWLLRAAREVYHPWYAYPGRFAAFLIVIGTAIGWALARAGRLLPARAHGARHPALAWSLTLPLWIAFAVSMSWFAPAAAYLWTIPLLAAGILLSAAPPDRDGAVRAASLLVFAVVAVIWVPESFELLWFTVAVMGRFAFITPAYVYPVLISIAAVMIAPPFIAAIAPSRPLARPSVATTLLLGAIAATAGLAYAAPAYTPERPLRRHVRALQDVGAASSIWEVGSVEPGLDLADNAPASFALAPADPAPASVPWGRLTFPFVFRAAAAPLGPAPAAITSSIVTPVGQGAEVSIAVVPQDPGVILAFVLPADLVPVRSNLPGVPRAGRWTATFAAPPREGVSWRATFAHAPPDALAAIRVVARVPWRHGAPAGSWGALPGWLPQERAVWTGSASWVLKKE